MFRNIRITYSEFFAVLNQRNLGIEEAKQIIINKKRIGEKDYYELIHKIPSGPIAGYVLFPDPPASRDNVYVSIEQLEEVAMIFGIQPKEVYRYSVSGEAAS